MPQFAQKLLSSPKRVCFRLKEMREAKHVSLLELSARTRISQRYLEAIEACDFSSIPFAVVYKKKFLKRYAEALGAPADEILRQFMEEEVIDTALAAPPPAGGIGKQLSNVPMLARGLFLSGLLVLMAGYLGVEIKRMIDPPHLQVFSPQDGFVTTEHSVVVQGQAEREVRVSINGQPIGHSDEGRFSTVLDLSPGMNAITVAAEKKHGKTTTATRYVILKANPSFSLKKNNLTLP